MAREFNPEIFGESARSTAPTGGHDVEPLKRKVRDLELQVQTLTQKIERMTMAFEQKAMQTQNAQKTFEGHVKQALQELSQGHSVLSGRITERKVADTKIQELVDRHNQLVHNFELRMTNLQKVSAEQEMKLMTYQSTIDEILREIRKLPHSAKSL
jgi:chromosome segregation ATPase